MADVGVGGAVLGWGGGATVMFAVDIRGGGTRTMPLALVTAMHDDLGEAVVLAVILLIFSTAIFISAHWLISRYEPTRFCASVAWAEPA